MTSAAIIDFTEEPLMAPLADDNAIAQSSLEPVGDDKPLQELSEALNIAVVQEILKKAPENLSDLLSDLKQGILNSDIEVVKRSAHTIKGTAESVGAIKIVGIAAHIEAISDDLGAVQNCLPPLEAAAIETTNWWNELSRKYADA
ncbi:MAG: Hpt domain-containing protein [Sneathiella sp.]